MKTKSAGSAVLLVLMLMGILTVLLLSTLHEVTFVRMLIGKQVASETSVSLGQGLLAYGITQAKKNYEALLKQPQEAQMELDLAGMLGHIGLTGSKEGVVIVSDLLQDSVIVFHASCLLTQDSDKEFIIQGFQR